MEDVIQEKISADHLLYVSLKYTKTCDVIINLLIRWRRMIELSIRKILDRLKKEEKIKTLPDNEIGRINEIKRIFKKDKNFLEVMEFYLMIRKIETLKKERVGEFRKNVALKVIFKGKEININLDQLKIYSEMLEEFVEKTKKILKQK